MSDYETKKADKTEIVLSKETKVKDMLTVADLPSKAKVKYVENAFEVTLPTGEVSKITVN